MRVSLRSTLGDVASNPSDYNRGVLHCQWIGFASCDHLVVLTQHCRPGASMLSEVGSCLGDLLHNTSLTQASPEATGAQYDKLKASVVDICLNELLGLTHQAFVGQMAYSSSNGKR